MKDYLWLEKPKIWPQNPEISLPLSKSISNRVLILEALSGGLVSANIHSEANDSIILQNILNNRNKTVWDVSDAGTTLRFLTAFAATETEPKIIKGTERMHQRPIKPLVDALNRIGAKVEYLEKEGFAPLKVHPSENGLECSEPIHFSDTRSSQFISALMLIGPVIKNGIRITFPNPFPSFGYIQLTAELMRKAGIELELTKSSVYIPEQSFSKRTVQVESDWSGASYFYSLFSLGDWDQMTLKNINLKSAQPDKSVSDIFRHLGVRSEQKSSDIILSKCATSDIEELDFADCPDIAMTVIVTFALKKVNLRVTGIENLIYKESNRIKVLQRELAKIGCSLTPRYGYWFLKSENMTITPSITVDPENDHRFAMAFSPLALFTRVQIKDPRVINKSFPNFWSELSKLGLHSGNDLDKSN